MTALHTTSGQDAKEISTADLVQVLAWNETVPPTIEACAHQLIEAKVRDQPDDEAICSREGLLTYRELDAYAEVLASRLILHGIKPDDLVPLCFEKSMWTVVAMLAVLKAGAAFVPMPCSPVQRIKTILSLVRPPVILTSTQQASKFVDMSDPVIIVGKGSCEAANLEPLEVSVKPSNLAYVIFTSGSTGIPKGVQMEHRQLCSHLKTWGDTVGFDRTSRAFQYGAYVFDAAIDEVFLPLIYGGTVCIPSDDDRMNNIAGAMRDMRVTFAFFTPSLLSTLRPEDFDLATLKTLVIGGEVSPQDLLTLWASVPVLQVFHAYGPTECCVICCAANMTRNGPRPRNIGRAIGDVCWVVDNSDIEKLATIGTVGELLIEGPTVSRGYLGDDESSVTTFVQSPSWLHDFRHGSSQRLYKTGDLVKYSKDGTIEFVGRKDDQVKLRGQRIELGEVEHHLRRALPSRATSIVELVSTASIGGEPMLVAFICLGDENGIKKSESSSSRLVTDRTIKQHFSDLIGSLKPQLSEDLPSYMIPSVFVAMESMPRLASSKIDRAGLRKIDIDSVLPATGNVVQGRGRESQRGPSTDTEEKLQLIWAQAFRIAPSRIGPDDHFFRLGGDSVTAIRLVAIARRAGLSLTVNMLFDHPVIANLAAAVQLSISTIQGKGMPGPYSLLGKEASSVKDLQHEAVTQCGISLNMIQDIYPFPKKDEDYMGPLIPRAAMTFPLPVEIDTDRYLECWKRLITSHDMLRTRIINTATGMYSVVVAVMPNIRTATDAGAFIMLEKKSTIGFGDALSAYCLIKDPDNVRKTCFVWTAHHIIYDEWSLDLINAKLRRAYADSNFTLTEDPKPKQLAEHFQNVDHEADRDYWRAHFAGVTFKHLFSRPTHRGWEADREIPLRISLSSSGTTESSAFTIPAIIAVAWALALSRHFQVADIALGIIRSGRTLPVEGIENYIGCVMNFPPWHMYIDETALAKQSVRNFQHKFWESTRHEAVGFRDFMTLSPEAAAAMSNLVLLNIHAKDVEVDEIESTGGIELPAPSEEMFYDMPIPLRLECEVEKQAISAVAVYDRSIGSKSVQAVMDAFEKVFLGLRSAGEEQRICDIASE